ncbi:MAG: hypothetical protein JSW04_00475 [Desulfobacterales bacterium]|nr:MAG: hypothetical protein JSW04_00475 [Desulfobacterales bacterium]
MLKLKIHISIKSYLGIVLLIVFSALLYNTVLAKETATEVINVYLKQRIETELIKNRFSCRSELICGVSLIPVFYQQRDFAPAWYRNGKI